jgi:hypothetical protein
MSFYNFMNNSWILPISVSKGALGPRDIFGTTKTQNNLETEKVAKR